MHSNPQGRVSFLEKSITKKKDKINNWLLIIGSIFIATILMGTGVGLVFGSIVKGIALGVAGGAVLSINPVIKINDLASEIDIDKREIATLNYQIKKEKNQVANISNKQTSAISHEEGKQSDFISDDDMDKMIDLFKKPEYRFKYDSQKNNENNSYDNGGQAKRR